MDNYLYIECCCRNSPFEDRIAYYSEKGQTFEQAKNSVGEEMGWETPLNNLIDGKETDIRKKLRSIYP